MTFDVNLDQIDRHIVEERVKRRNRHSDTADIWTTPDCAIWMVDEIDSAYR
jgi:hypothetical protein